MSPQLYRKAVRNYMIGFGVSLLLSLAAYSVVVHKLLPMLYAASVLLALAIIQLIVQLRIFLHLSTREASFFKTNSLLFTISTLLIIVVGSLWIMKNLDYRMGMSPEAMQQYMLKQNSKGF